jgi:hypothetical protein
MRADFILEEEKRNTIPLPLWSLNPGGRASSYLSIERIQGRADGPSGVVSLTLDRVDTAFDRAAARSKIDPKMIVHLVDGRAKSFATA